MQDGEKQRRLLKETRTAKKALEPAINIEIGIQNQLRISGTTAYTVQKQMAITSIYSMQNSWKRPKSSTTNFNKPTICPNCGYTWSATHRQKCPAGRKNCKDCGITNHFAIKSVESLRFKRSQNHLSTMLMTPLLKLLHTKYDANYESDYDEFDNYVAVISDSDNIREVEPVKMHIQFGSTETKA